MRKWSWVLAGFCVVAAPGIASAQEKEDPDNFDDILGGVLSANWNVSAYGGWTKNGEFLLQALPGSGERELRSSGSWNVGVGFGVDILKRLGGRLTYTYSSGDLVFRTDNGDGSAALNADNLAKITTNVVSAELVHYMLPVRESINPYASIGLLGAWWGLHDETSTIVASGGSSQFRWGAAGSVGLQLKISRMLYGHLEWATASIGNPFSGAESYTVPTGVPIDEPTSVNKTDYRFGLMYRF